MPKNKKALHNERIAAADMKAARRGFHVGDVLLVVLAVLAVAVMIFAASVIVPAVRENFREYDENLTFTVEFPFTETENHILPRVGDIWVLLDSEDAVCTVRAVEYSEETSFCRVTLLRKDATYREGKGYMIEGTRISVGSKIYFRRDPEHYFAAIVTALDTDRFERPEETTAEAEDEGTKEGNSNG